MSQSPESSGELASTPASTSSSRSDSRVARPTRLRNRRRNGPPGFQFIIAQDPSQFKDEKTKRSVRSQAMIQYRYKARIDSKKAQKEKQRQSSRDTPDPPQCNGRPAVVGIVPPTSRDGPTPTWYLASPDTTNFPLDQRWENSVSVPPGPSQRYFRVLFELSRLRGQANFAAKKVNAYEEWDETQRDTFFRLLESKFSSMTVSPVGYDVGLPRFTSKELNDTRGVLVRECVHAFTSPATKDRWFPSMMVHEHILLSATTLVSTWIDMRNGIPGDSTRTILVKSEIIGWINDRLSNTAQQYEDATLMVILHLLAGELWSCNEAAIRVHEEGVSKLITHRGGIDNLGGNGATAEVAAACCLHSDVLCEARMLPLFQDWEPSKLAPVADTTVMPESPLLCPRAELFTLAADPKCSMYTYELMCDMRDFTNLFIAHNLGLDAVPDMDQDLVSYALSDHTYLAKVSEIRTRLVSLPSACAGLPGTANDWIYESCRIASIIYMSAILARVPFSFAGLPGYACLLAELSPAAKLTRTGQPLDTMHLSEALYETLLRTNSENVWGGMAGVLYWVSLVGAAAARSTVEHHMPQARSSSNTATWVRRCLVMYATRSMIIMIFQHPLPIIMAQRKMLTVQELIGSGRGGILANAELATRTR